MMSDLQRRCLLALLELEEKHPDRCAFTPNEIGLAAGAATFRQHKWRAGVKGPAQQIIQPLTALCRHRGLITYAQRDDGMSGTAYQLNVDGREAAEALREQ